MPDKKSLDQLRLEKLDETENGMTKAMPFR